MTTIEKLNKLVEGGVKIREIEKAVKFPENQLSAMLKGKKPLPKKWHDILDAYVVLQDIHKSMIVELPKDFLNVNKVAIITADGKIEPLQTPMPDWAKDYVWGLGEVVALINRPSVMKITPKSNTKDKKEDQAWKGGFYIPDGKPVEKIEMVWDKGADAARIKVLEDELKNPPKNPQIGMRTWRSIRENELAALKSKPQ